jgi:hypothetical protein
VLEQKQLVFESRILSLLRHDFFLQRKGICKIHSVKPTHREKSRRCRKLHQTTYDPQTAVQDAILSPPRAARDMERSSGLYR